jgi:hypothetical protein
MWSIILKILCLRGLPFSKKWRFGYEVNLDSDEPYGTLSKNIIQKNESKYIWMKLCYGTPSKKKNPKIFYPKK